MADFIDDANETAELFLQAALRKSQGKGKAPLATGFCLNCQEKLAEGARWCDADCREDWEKRGRNVKG